MNLARETQSLNPYAQALLSPEKGDYVQMTYLKWFFAMALSGREMVSWGQKLFQGLC